MRVVKFISLIIIFPEALIKILIRILQVNMPSPVWSRRSLSSVSISSASGSVSTGDPALSVCSRLSSESSISSGGIRESASIWAASSGVSSSSSSSCPLFACWFSVPSCSFSECNLRFHQIRTKLKPDLHCPSPYRLPVPNFVLPQDEDPASRFLHPQSAPLPHHHPSFGQSPQLLARLLLLPSRFRSFFFLLYFFIIPIPKLFIDSRGIQSSTFRPQKALSLPLTFPNFRSRWVHLR